MESFQREDFGYSRTVSYVNKNHLSLIFQRWGSVNQKVFPFCLANALLSVVLIWLLDHGIDLTISEFGHEFMSILVAFFVINKLSFTLSLYYEYQGYLSKMNESSIELTQLVCAFTSGYQQEAYKEWRFDVTAQVLLLLKVSTFVVYKGGQVKVWEIQEFENDPPELLLPDNLGHHVMNIGNNTATNTETSTSAHKQFLKNHGRRTQLPKELYVWGYHLDSDKNLRVPIRVAQRVREAIMKHRSLPMDPIDSIQEQQLLNCVKDIMESYRGIRKYLTVPLPLPLVQLGRLFVMFYVFTLPFALLSPSLNLKYFQMIVLIVITTYGFMGIELLYVEMDDPFADDPNDLPLTEEARAAGEDIALSLWHIDGQYAIDRFSKTFAVDDPVFPLKRIFPKTGSKETDPLV